LPDFHSLLIIQHRNESGSGAFKEERNDRERHRSALAELVKGQVAGDGALVICSARTLQDALVSDITFWTTPGSRRSWRRARQCRRRSCQHARAARTLIKSPIRCSPSCHRSTSAEANRRPTDRHRRTGRCSFQCGRSADASIHPFAVVGAVRSSAALPAAIAWSSARTAGSAMMSFSIPMSSVYDDTVMGDRVSFTPTPPSAPTGSATVSCAAGCSSIPQLGNVVLGADVEIGAARRRPANLRSTIIGTGTKIDNLVQIAHNCQIGEHNALAAQIGICRLVHDGELRLMGGQVGVKDHIQIGDRAQFGAKTGVSTRAAGKAHVPLSRTGEREAPAPWFA